MTYFLKSGNTYRVSAKEAMDLREHLPGGNYLVKKDPYENLYLEAIDNFEIKGKIYGDTLKHTRRVLATFADRPSATGVMLSGEKGSGKTLLAKNICAEAARQDIPTIVINTPWCGDQFNSLVQSIEQPCIVLFDEFEKVYDNDEQEQMLTLLDGVFPSKKLFILTCNDKWRVNEHMRNRPGRIYYMLDFAGLDAGFIREYCVDNLKNKNYTEDVVQIAGVFDKFNFDMLKALIEEMNRFDESPQESIRMLNTKPEFSGHCRYEIKLVVDGEEIPREKLSRQETNVNPLTSQFSINYKKEDEHDDDGWVWGEIEVDPKQLKKIDDNGTRYIFNTCEGTVILKRVQEKTIQYWDAF